MTIGIGLGLAAVLASLAAADSATRSAGALAYRQKILRILDAVELQVPQLAASASAAANHYVRDETLGLGVDGTRCFIHEVAYRSGGLMAVSRPDQMKKAPWKGIVLYALRKGQTTEDAKRLADYAKRGCPLVIFGTERLLNQVHLSETAVLGKVVVPASSAAAPTYPLATMATLWPWMGEFVAACTRAGKMPPMYQSIRVPMARDRNEQLRNVRFHADNPRPITAGVLAKAYLHSMRSRLAKLQQRQAATITRIAQLAVERRRQGKHLFMVGGAHGAAYLTEGSNHPGLFEDITQRWRQQHAKDYPPGHPKIAFEPGDILLVVGYDYVPNTGGWFNLADKARQGGATLILCIATFRPDQMSQVKPGDVLLDMPWGLGDADVSLPGYDVKILPTSNVLAAAVYGMINAETSALASAATQPTGTLDRVRKAIDRKEESDRPVASEGR